MKQKIKSLIADFKNTDKVQKKDWIIFGIIAFILFTCFFYVDIQFTTVHTLNYTKAILSGNFLDLYKVNYLAVINGIETTVCYDIPIYFLLIIWNFPLWILRDIFNINVINSFFCILWMKGLLVLFLWLSSKVIVKICEEIKLDKKYIKWIVLIFLSSPFIFSSLFMLCQCDIIAIFFMLLGILAYIQNDEKRFLLWFAVAIPMKLFSLFVFIPLLLLKEKRVLKIMYKGLIGLSILLASKIIQTLFMPLYVESTKAFNGDMMGRLFNTSGLNINFGVASLFIAFYVGICIFCYIKNIKDKEELYKYSIYIPFVVFLILFLFILYHPYWLIYLTPFFAILLFMNAKYYKVNLLLGMVYELVSLFIITNYFTWCFSANQLKYMLISKIFTMKNIENVKSLSTIYNNFGLTKFVPCALGIVLAVTIALIIINYPRLNKQDESIVIERSLIWARMLIILPFALLMILCYVL